MILRNSTRLTTEDTAFCTIRPDSPQRTQRAQRGHRGGKEAQREGIFSPRVPFGIRAMLDIMHSLMRLRAKERGPKSSLNESLNQNLKGGPSTLPPREMRYLRSVPPLWPLCPLW